MTTRSLSELRSVCPGCGLRRFIPRYTAPYCTPSCRRTAPADQPSAPRAGEKE